MVGKKKANQLGRCLIKSRYQQNRNKHVESDMVRKIINFLMENSSFIIWFFQLTAAAIKEENEIDKLINMQSVTEEDSFTAFLRQAELAGTNFEAEKLNIHFVNSKSNVGLLSEGEQQKITDVMKENAQFLRIPRRPKWDKDTTAEELHTSENQSFLEWRRDLAIFQEKEEVVMTPYERNIEFWRQLWRVVEKSDVVVQIVDARNPLLFYSEDLSAYVNEVDANKMNVLLANKADYLTYNQRIKWAEYFDSKNVKVVFFSALDPEAEDDTIQEESEEEEDDKSSESDADDEQDESEEDVKLPEIKQEIEKISSELNQIEEVLDKIEVINEVIVEREIPKTKVEPGKNNPDILSRQELIDFFKSTCDDHPVIKFKENKIIGLMGYPNVGKSSTINALLQAKKVSVSATPGKTKHFQTLYLESNLILCDCCGLVLPSFCYTKAEMVLNGILPPDQMRDYVAPVNLLCTLIPRHCLEDVYGILIAKPLEGEDPNRSPYAEEVLLAYAYNRGFMTANGQPDQSRAARKMVKDFVNGKLLFCVSPPNAKQTEFHTFPERQKEEVKLENLPPRQQRSMRIQTKTTTTAIDDVFFKPITHNAHVQGRSLALPGQSIMNGVSTSSINSVGLGKPWKGQKREKREKLRRKYAHLDQH